MSHGTHPHTICRDEDADRDSGRLSNLPVVHSKKVAEPNFSVATVSTLCALVNESMHMCAVVCVAVCACTRLTSFMSTVDRGEEKIGIFTPIRAQSFGGKPGLKGCPQRYLLYALGLGMPRTIPLLYCYKCPSKALLCTLLDFLAGTLQTAGIRQLRGL